MPDAQWSAASPPVPVAPSGSGGSAANEEAGASGARLRRLVRGDQRRRAEENWEAVAAALQSKGSKALAQSLLLRLNSAALGHLAAHLTAGPYTYRKQLLAGEVYQRWGEADFPAALAQAQRLERGMRWACAQQAILGLSNVHPAEVCQFLASPPTEEAQYELRAPGNRLSLLNQTVVKWGEQDPAAAGAFLLQHPDLADRSAWAVGAVAEGWAPQDPRAAVDWATRLPAKNRDDALQKVFASWAQTDLPGSLTYLSNLPAGRDRDHLLNDVGFAWGKQNPQEAARWAETQGDAAASVVLDAWSEQDPAGALAWAVQRTAIRFDPTTWDAATTNYIMADRNGALQWINGLPAGRERDGAVAAYSRAAGTGKDILTALNLLQTMSRPLPYEVNTARLLDNWLSIQPEAARQWINQANLPPEVTGKLTGL